MTTKRLFVILTSLSLALILADRSFSFALDVPKNLTQKAFRPLLLPLHSIGFRLFSNVDFLLSLPSIYQQNRQLKDKLSEMAYLVNQNQKLQQENQALRNQLTIAGATDQKLLPVQVLGKTNVGTDVYLLINAGTKQGIKPGQVVVFEKSLIGQVESVSQSLARVVPIFSSKSEVLVLVGEEGATGKVVGELNTRLKLVEVLQEEELKEGAPITTSGAHGVFPPGLLVGRVGKIFSKDWQVYQEAQVELFWEEARLGTVFVMME